MRKNVFLSVGQQPKQSVGRLIVDVSTSHEIKHTHPVGTIITWLGINRAPRLQLRDTAKDHKIMFNFLLTTTHIFVICTNLYAMGFIHSFIHSFSILSDERSKASSKTMPPHSAIQSFLLQMRISSPVLKVIQQLLTSSSTSSCHFHLPLYLSFDNLF